MIDIQSIRDMQKDPDFIEGMELHALRISAGEITPLTVANNKSEVQEIIKILQRKIADA